MHQSCGWCDIGERSGATAGQTHIDVAYAENNIGIWSPNGQSNSYELPKSRIGCWIQNNILGLDVDEGQLTSTCATSTTTASRRIFRRAACR